MQKWKTQVALVAMAAIVVSACSSGATPTPSATAAASGPTSVGEGEGELSLIAWAGYVVGGTGGEQVEGYDWVTPFETASGCKVTVKVGLDSANMVQLMKTGQYDGVSASGDATLRLIANGDVAEIDVTKMPDFPSKTTSPDKVITFGSPEIVISSYS